MTSIRRRSQLFSCMTVYTTYKSEGVGTSKHVAARGTWPPYRSPRESFEATSADARDVMDDFSSTHPRPHETTTYLQPKHDPRGLFLAVRRSYSNEIKTITKTVFET